MRPTAPARPATRYLAAAIVVIALAAVPIAFGHSHASADGERIGAPVRDDSGSAPRCPLCRLTSHEVDAPGPPPAPPASFVVTAVASASVEAAIETPPLPSTPRAPPALV